MWGCRSSCGHSKPLWWPRHPKNFILPLPWLYPPGAGLAPLQNEVLKGKNIKFSPGSDVCCKYSPDHLGSGEGLSEKLPLGKDGNASMTCGIVSLSSLNYAIHLLPCHVNAAPPPAAPPYTLPPPFTSTIRLCEYGQRIRCCGGDLHRGRPTRGRCRIPSCHPASPLAVGRAGKLTQAWGVWPLGWGGEGTRCNPPATRPGDAGHGCGKRCGRASCAAVVEWGHQPCCHVVAMGRMRPRGPWRRGSCGQLRSDSD